MKHWRDLRIDTPSHWQARRVDDVELLRSWRNGLDTAAIARKFFVKEAEVANRLPRVLQAARDGRLVA